MQTCFSILGILESTVGIYTFLLIGFILFMRNKLETYYNI